MSIAMMNSRLHRNIKSGTQYNKYFTNVSCKQVFLGEGVTTFGLHKMKDWTNQYYTQTKKIAEVLKGKTLQQTCNNIKQFLYDHLQYDADGFHQNLRSPNCSWVSRKEGIDCKSYSIFAGSILKNLGIPFYYRKITQPASPKKWSHVYVVVKDGVKELIIDATVPFNYEVDKVKQEDLLMEAKLPYYGLNGLRSSQTLTVKEQDDIETVQRFKAFLSSLNNDGISPFVTNRIIAEVRKYTDKGIDPKLEIASNYIKVNGTSIPFGKDATKGLQGLGFWDQVGTAVLSSGGQGNGGGADIIKNILGTFTSIFGKDPKKHAKSRITLPMANHIESKLASANQSTLHETVGELDFHLNAYISHEKNVNSKYSKVAIPELQKMLDTLRSKYKSLGTSPASGNGSHFEGFWTAGERLVHAGNVSYYRYNPATFNVDNNFDFTSNIQSDTTVNRILDNITQLSNGLFLDTKTQTTYTPQQVQQLRVQSARLPQSSNKGLSTMAWAGIGVGVLALAFFGAKKLNYI